MTDSVDPERARGQAAPADGLATVERAFALLQCFEDADALTLAELARASGLPKPTVLRFARKLVELGMLEHDGARYRLGLRLFELGSRVDQQSQLRERALPYMQRIHGATHHIVHLAVRADDEIVFVERLRSHNGRELRSPMGTRMPMHSTALGKTLLAHAPSELRERVLAQPLAPLTEHTLRDPEELAAQLEQVRQEGVADSREEYVADLRCVAAPILDADGDALAALSISAYRQPFDRAAMAAVAVRAARAIERQLARTTP